MTVGFPDFGRQAVQTGVPSINVNRVINAAITTSVAYVGDYGLMDVIMNGNNLADYYSVILRYWSDANRTIQLGSSSFVSVPGIICGLQMPSLSQYADFSISPAAGTDVTPFIMYANATNMRHPNPWQAVKAVPPYLVNQSIAAGSSVQTVINSFFPGESVLTIDSVANGAWHFILERFVVNSNSWSLFWRYDSEGVKGTFHGTVMIPPVPLRATVFNDDTSAHTTVATLIPIVQ